MQKQEQKLTILYSRLSRDDENNGTSESIVNQEKFLRDYAAKNNFPNPVCISDDGHSGTNFQRPGWLEVISLIEQGKVGILCSKDSSRLGRSYLQMGLYREMFQEKGVRLICVNDGVDSLRGEDDFVPFREIINEWYARDTSRKIRAINGSRTSDGKHVTGAIPYGYLRDPSEKSRWILDEEAAPNVARMFRMVIEGISPTQIADTFTAEGILIPSAHWEKVGAGMRKWEGANPTRWSVTCVTNILKKQEYMGWCVLNKTVKETYKSKRQKNDPENVLIFKDMHPAIVDEEMWTVVQKLRETKRVPQRATGETHPFTGILYCPDCGQKMYYKRGSTGRQTHPHDEYCCSSYRHYSRRCTCHYIRVNVVESLILTAIRNASGYVRENQGEFIEKVRALSAVQQAQGVKDNRKKLTKSKRRQEEVATLIKKLYESYALDKIPEKNFTDLLAEYNDEQAKLETEIAELETAITEWETDSVRADKFIEMVQKYTEFPELTPQILNSFVDRVYVHEADKSSGKRTQEIEIHFNFIGNLSFPQVTPEQPQEETPRTSTKKLRRDMTESEIEKERERDRQRYAVKRNARLAKEREQRYEILSGTSFANFPAAVNA
ncbi:recombinase [Clostridia bacterium]|nr:recombinase [Clostridia bacterium]